MNVSNDKKLEIQKITPKMEIPNNKLAKLIYYLECVFTVIQTDRETIYKNKYFNYHLVSKEEEENILDLVSKFNSKVMLELNLFVIEPDFVPIDEENQFYDISDKKFEGKVNSEVIIGEITRKVLKVMACKQSWIDKYYSEPLKEYENSSKEEKKEINELNYLFNENIFNWKKKKECRCCFTSCPCCFNCDVDEYCENCCCCCGYQCPYITICSYNICPDECSCYCCREFVTGILGCCFCMIFFSPFILYFISFFV